NETENLSVNSRAAAETSLSAKPGEVSCDVCTGTKLKALKSCLVCLTSYCETHLEPHLTKSGLKRHQLIDPVENLEDRMCTKHEKLLELFCKTDQTCICMLCSVLDHKTHDVVPLKEEYEGERTELRKTEVETQQMIQKRRLKIQEIKHSVKLTRERVDREIAEGVQVFKALKESVERCQAEFTEIIREQQRTTEKQAEDFVKELEQEISELKKRSTEVEQLSSSEDHLRLLQRFSSLNTAPPTKDWTNVSVRPPSYEARVLRVLNQLEESLSKQVKKLFEAKLKKVKQYAVGVTLDPDIVHTKLPQSNAKQKVNQNDDCRCVLSQQGFTSGRFYFEVQVKKWSKWTVGVAREHYMKREIPLNPRNGYWTLCLTRQHEYFASAEPSVSLFLKSKPEKVGVFVDYEEGLAAFFDIDTAALIYCFTSCSFTGKIYPFFSPCPNDAVKIHNTEIGCVLQ
uniref:B30.2/SPRY domain-containing protein n=1 Tax=Lates calcarifer TaxID=8187 RepID=A0A4W6DP34_LATCA